MREYLPEYISYVVSKTTGSGQENRDAQDLSINWGYYYGRGIYGKEIIIKKVGYLI